MTNLAQWGRVGENHGIFVEWVILPVGGVSSEGSVQQDFYSLGLWSTCLLQPKSYVFVLLNLKTM